MTSKFRIDDLELPWTFEQPLDLVHSRVCSGLAIKDWPKYLSESYRCLRPGGWVEAQEFSMRLASDDDSFPPNSAILGWHEIASRGMLLGGSDMTISSQQIKSYMQDAGFVNVQVIDMKLPISGWSNDPKLKEAGMIMKESMLSDIHGLSSKIFIEFLEWTVEELDTFLEQVHEEWQRDDIHAYWPV
jgi:Methyltransferase domain